MNPDQFDLNDIEDLLNWSKDDDNDQPVVIAESTLEPPTLLHHTDHMILADGYYCKAYASKVPQIRLSHLRKALFFQPFSTPRETQVYLANLRNFLLFNGLPDFSKLQSVLSQTSESHESIVAEIICLLKESQTTGFPLLEAYLSNDAPLLRDLQKLIRIETELVVFVSEPTENSVSEIEKQQHILELFLKDEHPRWLHDRAVNIVLSIFLSYFLFPSCASSDQLNFERMKLYLKSAPKSLISAWIWVVLSAKQSKTKPLKESKAMDQALKHFRSVFSKDEKDGKSLLEFYSKMALHYCLLFKTDEIPDEIYAQVRESTSEHLAIVWEAIQKSGQLGIRLFSFWLKKTIAFCITNALFQTLDVILPASFLKDFPEYEINNCW